ncbi:MAG: LysR family transcriptional regulator substrate-binding protein [Rhodocyclaceae bacterium]|nr:LysR family transcriptional regulator substrate-binding protein [Rhodocyclaceae bacterium]
MNKTKQKSKTRRTPEAESLMPEVERLFGDVQAIEHLADEVRDGISGSVSIGNVTTLSTSLVANAVARFLQQHRGLRMDIRSMSTCQVVEAVATHQVDVGVVDIAPAGQDLEATELCRLSRTEDRAVPPADRNTTACRLLADPRRAADGSQSGAGAPGRSRRASSPTACGARRVEATIAQQTLDGSYRIPPTLVRQARTAAGSLYGELSIKTVMCSPQLCALGKRRRRICLGTRLWRRRLALRIVTRS